MRTTLILLALVVLSSCAHEYLKKCLQEKCPDQYNKCLATSGCEAKMDKCADKCGTQVNKLCWTTCIGLPGAAANLAVCAANVGCVGVSEADNLVMNVYEYVQDLARERLQ